MSNPYLSELIALCRTAGAAVMEIYRSQSLDVQRKADASPVTRADMASHRILLEGLQALADLPVLSEEAEVPPWEQRRQWCEYWLVDPLDGTREFIKGNGEFTINVALVRDGRPVLGVVYAPDKELWFWGGVGLGAFRQSGSDVAEAIHCAPPPKEVWRVLGSRSFQSPQLTEFLARLPAYELLSVGSSLKLCLVASGEADLYPRFGPISEWDTAAAQAVVEAAGGQVLNWHTLRPLTYNTKDSLLNPPFIVCAAMAEPWLLGRRPSPE